LGDHSGLRNLGADCFISCALTLQLLSGFLRLWGESTCQPGVLVGIILRWGSFLFCIVSKRRRRREVDRLGRGRDLFVQQWNVRSVSNHRGLLLHDPLADEKDDDEGDHNQRRQQLSLQDIHDQAIDELEAGRVEKRVAVEKDPIRVG
jgi:hypothetical protein